MVKKNFRNYFSILAASLDILFPELAKAQSSKDVNDVRSKLRKVFLFSFSIPILFFIFRGFANRYIYFITWCRVC